MAAMIDAVSSVLSSSKAILKQPAFETLRAKQVQGLLDAFCQESFTHIEIAAALSKIAAGEHFSEDDKEKLVLAAAACDNIRHDKRPTKLRASEVLQTHGFFEHYLHEPEWSALQNDSRVEKKLKVLVDACARMRLFYPTEQTQRRIIGVLAMCHDIAPSSCHPYVTSLKEGLRSARAQVPHDSRPITDFPIECSDPAAVPSKLEHSDFRLAVDGVPLRKTNGHVKSSAAAAPSRQTHGMEQVLSIMQAMIAQRGGSHESPARTRKLPLAICDGKIEVEEVPAAPPAEESQVSARSIGDAVAAVSALRASKEDVNTPNARSKPDASTEKKTEKRKTTPKNQPAPKASAAPKTKPAPKASAAPKNQPAPKMCVAASRQAWAKGVLELGSSWAKSKKRKDLIACMPPSEFKRRRFDKTIGRQR